MTGRRIGHGPASVREILAGLTLFALALAAWLLTHDLAVGTLTAMGPGFMPRMLAILLAGCGVAQVVHGLRKAATPAGAGDTPPPALVGLWRTARNTALIIGGIVFFDHAVEYAGLVLAMLALVVVVSLAGDEIGIGQIAVLSVVLCFLSLLIIKLPLIRIWIHLLNKYMFPAIILSCAIGAYSINGSAFEVDQLALFGLAGFLLYKLGFEPALLLFGFILGPMLEENLRRALTLAHGDLTTFVTRPVSSILLLVCAVVLVFAMVPVIRGRREQIFKEDY